jgi:hypothetical protein
MMDEKAVRNMQNVIPKLSKFEKLVHLVGSTVEKMTVVTVVVS